VCLGRAQKDSHLVKPVAVLERRLQPLLVRNEHGQRDIVGHVDPGQHRHRVVELGDHVSADEARHLDPLEAGPREGIDQPDLVLGRDPLGFVLKPVPGPDLADPDPGRERSEIHSLTAVVNLS